MNQFQTGNSTFAANTQQSSYPLSTGHTAPTPGNQQFPNPYAPYTPVGQANPFQVAVPSYAPTTPFAQPQQSFPSALQPQQSFPSALQPQAPFTPQGAGGQFPSCITGVGCSTEKGSRRVPYKVTYDRDLSAGGGPISYTLSNICCMPEYLTLGIDELRYEDYKFNKTGQNLNPPQDLYKVQPTSPWAPPSNAFTSQRTPAVQNPSPFANPTALAQPIHAFPQATALPQQNPFTQPVPNPFATANATLVPFQMPQPTFAPTSSFTVPSANPFSHSPKLPSASPFQPVRPPLPQSSPFTPKSSFSMPPPALRLPVQSVYTPPVSSAFFVNPTPNFNPHPMPSSAFPQVLQPTNPSYMLAKTSPYPVPTATTMEPLVNAFKDPHGLGLLFPNEVPDYIVKNIEKKHELREERGAVGKAKLNAKLREEKLREKAVRTFHGEKNQGLFEEPLRARAEPFIFSRRDQAFQKKLEPLTKKEAKVTVLHSEFEVILVPYDSTMPRLAFPVTKETTIRELKIKALQSLEALPTDIQLTYNGQAVPEYTALQSLFIRDKAILHIVLPAHPSPPSSTYPALPVLKKPHYSTTPSLQELSQLSPSQLKRIKNFTIENPFGRITFDGETDVRELNLDEIVRIEDRLVTLYPDNAPELKPRVGEGLNKPATITLYKCFPRSHTSPRVFEEKIRRSCEKNATEYISWNEATGEWIFRISSA